MTQFAQLMVVMVICLLIAGCGDLTDASRRATSSIALDLGALIPAEARAQELDCVSVLGDAVLRVDGREARRQAFAPRWFTLTFDQVTVDVGEVALEVGVFSTRGALLHAGERTTRIDDDGFQVSVPLQARDAVSIACPSEIQLGEAVDYTDVITLFNTGSDTVSFSAHVAQDRCDGPCLWIERESEIVRPASFVRLWIGSDSRRPGADRVVISTRLGEMAIDVETEPTLTPP